MIVIAEWQAGNLHDFSCFVEDFANQLGVVVCLALWHHRLNQIFAAQLGMVGSRLFPIFHDLWLQFLRIFAEEGNALDGGIDMRTDNLKTGIVGDLLVFHHVHLANLAIVIPSQLQRGIAHVLQLLHSFGKVVEYLVLQGIYLQADTFAGRSNRCGYGRRRSLQCARFTSQQTAGGKEGHLF